MPGYSLLELNKRGKKQVTKAAKGSQRMPWCTEESFFKVFKNQELKIQVAFWIFSIHSSNLLKIGALLGTMSTKSQTSKATSKGFMPSLTCPVEPTLPSQRVVSPLTPPTSMLPPTSHEKRG